MHTLKRQCMTASAAPAALATQPPLLPLLPVVHQRKLVPPCSSRRRRHAPGKHSNGEEEQNHIGFRQSNVQLLRPHSWQASVAHSMWPPYGIHPPQGLLGGRHAPATRGSSGSICHPSSASCSRRPAKLLHGRRAGKGCPLQRADCSSNSCQELGHLLAWRACARSMRRRHWQQS